MFIRIIEKNIQEYLSGETHKILFIWGPRRSGKSTLLSKISAEQNARIFNFEFLSDREGFQPRREFLEKLARDHPIILIDEVQSYPESTVPLKLLHDEYKVKIIATGSSELRKKGQEFDSLAGRYQELFCLPFSVEEISDNTPHKAYEESDFVNRLREEVLVFGTYPEVFAASEQKEAKTSLLENIVESYILKDIVSLYELKNLKLAKDILTKIALQIGQEVSMREIASSLMANVGTVSNYIEIFIKNYILIPLPSFKTNIRRAVSENRKLYFYDLGIRNALVKDFRRPDLRPDKGGLFENFIVSELEKRRRIQRLPMSAYFYREYGGKEVDVVLENYYKEYQCVEIKYESQKAMPVFPLPHTLRTIDKNNFLDEIRQVR
jgi:predicted AAA+ superfamily ATPase